MQHNCGTTNFSSLPDLPSHGGNQVGVPCDGATQPTSPPPAAAAPAPAPVATAAPTSAPQSPPILGRFCYRVGATGLFSNGGGQSCGLLGPNLQASCGTSDFNALQARNDHGGNQVQGPCILPQGCYQTPDGAGRSANGNGHSCTFGSEAAMRSHCNNASFGSLKMLPSIGGDHDDGACQ